MNKPPSLISPSLSPNTNPEDGLWALWFLLRPWTWQQGVWEKHLRESLGQIFPGQDAYIFQSGRAALYTLLRSFGVGSGDEVLLQAFTCVAAVNPIIWVGAKPIYVDIDPDSGNLDVLDLARKISPRSKIVVVQHTFGFPALMEPILDLALERNLIVIEDCAHALGATYRGRSLGSWGQAAYFSFGRDKIISGVFGGMAWVNDANVRPFFEKEYLALGYPPASWIGQQLLHPPASELIKKTYFKAKLGRVLHNLLLGSGLLSRANTEAEKKKMRRPVYIPSRMPNALAALVHRQLRDLEKNNQQRRTTALKYIQALKGMPELCIPSAYLKFDNKEIKPTFLRFNLLTDQAEELISFAKKKGVVLGDWYRHIIDPIGVDLAKVGYKIGMCRKAEVLAQHSVNLPTYAALQDEEVARIIALAKDFFRSKASHR